MMTLMNTNEHDAALTEWTRDMLAGLARIHSLCPAPASAGHLAIDHCAECQCEFPCTTRITVDQILERISGPESLTDRPA